MSQTILFALGCGVLGIIYSAMTAMWVSKQDAGNAKMQGISNAVKEGAMAFLAREYKTVAMVAVPLAVLLSFLGIWTAIGFVIGTVGSAVAGYIGMMVSVRANVRTAQAAHKGLQAALGLAFKGGSVTGVMVVGLGIIGLAGFYFIAQQAAPEQAFHALVGLGFGCSLMSVFARIAGGIYTKAADVGADLVGKVEAGIPEDDPRNPAVIADNVGDNVGDCAGMAADLYETYTVTLVAAMLLGVLLFPVFGVAGVFFPLVARSFGLIATIAGVFAVRAKEDERPMSALNRGYYVTTGLAVVLFAAAAYAMLQDRRLAPIGNPDAWLFLFLAGFVGIITSLAFVYITQYYTEAKYRPVKEIAKASETGPATNILAGFGVGLEATALPIITVAVAILASFKLGELALPPNVPAGFPGGGFYGTAVATMGMLATAAYILAEDTFGPITDNAAGILEMSGKSGESRQRMDKLDAAGNTTKALTKGYAVGSAALAAFLLFQAYLSEGNVLRGANGCAVNCLPVINLG